MSEYFRNILAHNVLREPFSFNLVRIYLLIANVIHEY